MAEKITREQKLYNIGYLIKLLNAAIKGTQPPEPDERVRFEGVYSICKKHDIANTVFYAVEKLNNKPEEKLYKKWRDERSMGIHRHMIQKMEANAVKEAFNENEIDFMPVKGFSVCALYPEPDYRYMGDLDYLIREKDLKKAGVIVKSMGYMPDEIGKVHHDEYKKPPLMVLELHHAMVNPSSRFHDYYNGFIDKCENVGGHEYKMSGEDFYIFQLVHLNKHYEEAGTGIRSFLDMYLINKKMLPNLNQEYIDAEIKKLGLTEFFEHVKYITDKWFEREDLGSFSADELYIITSGVYGLDRHRYENRMKNKTKAQFFRERIFPSKAWMIETYPILKKSILFLPFTYIHRMFVKSIRNRKDIKNELKTLKK